MSAKHDGNVASNKGGRVIGPVKASDILGTAAEQARYSETTFRNRRSLLSAFGSVDAASTRRLPEEYTQRFTANG